MTEVLDVATGAQPGALEELFVTSAAAERHAPLVRRAATAGVPVLLVAESVIEALSETVHPQGVVGVARYRDVPLADVVAARPRLVAVLAAVRDPGNAGAVLRVADAAGAEAVVFTDASVDPHNGKCVRASAGSLFHLPVVVDSPSAATVASLRGAGLTILAASTGGRLDLDELLDRAALPDRVAWLFGNEARGLPPDLRAAADAEVRIPIYGRAESLNLATAAAVCLYATARSQHAGSRPVHVS